MIKAKRLIALIISYVQWISIGNAALYWLVKAVIGAPHHVTDGHYMKAVQGFLIEGNPTIYKLQMIDFKILLVLILSNLVLTLIFSFLEIFHKPATVGQVFSTKEPPEPKSFLQKLGTRHTLEPSVAAIEQQIDAIPQTEKFTIDDRKWRCHGHDLHVV